MTAETGNWCGNAVVYAEGWGRLMGIDDLAEAVWQADIHPDSRGGFDAVIGHLLGRVESTAEVPSWAEG
ncbi:hypothetical protein [Streptomyces sp. NPDC086182]|uniref:hypothetical protein n=1 Tax=Streptomyces sp. NPDC086182 TaxID=3155058 RepID=UPI003420CEB2